VFSPLTWDVFQIIVDILFWIMNAYVFNQPRRHQLLSNALHVLETKINKIWNDTSYD
jgi:hypothetical protein